MKNLLNVDTGHLIGHEGRAGFISTDEFGRFAEKYGGVFEKVQSSLRAKSSQMTIALDEEPKLPGIKAIAKKLAAKYEHILLLGIGGSALGARAVLQFLKGPFYNLESHGHPRIFVLDNIDPVITGKVEELIDIKKTAVIYTSKSGSTPETAAQFIYFYNKYRSAGGDPRDIVICCDPGDNGINRIAGGLNCHLLHIPRNLGGRYSVLSSVGFLPAELAGIDSGGLLAGAKAVHDYITTTPAAENALFTLGTCLHELSLRGKSIHVLFNYSNLLYEFGLWFVQLWAESLGKRLSLSGEVVQAGTTPLTSLGATDQHSILQLFKEGPDDKVFGFIRIENVPRDITLPGEFTGEKEYAYFAGHTMHGQLHIEQLSTEMSLAGAGKPCYRIGVSEISEACLGALFYFYEALVVYTAALWNINPYDQPGVEEGKNITYSLMGRQDYSHRREEYRQAVERYEQERKNFNLHLRH
ncbi:hypothetical protein [Desulfotruncus alcoholivorax]|uniref:hypothetical protein n=1 Tax=Desulfotruncus alcoholivorax TaxID=265477 RepID=UPI00040B0F24|nr:hypothetical protein [Desulfotruncus alcoholivorax]